MKTEIGETEEIEIKKADNGFIVSARVKVDRYSTERKTFIFPRLSQAFSEAKKLLTYEHVEESYCEDN